MLACDPSNWHFNGKEELLFYLMEVLILQHLTLFGLLVLNRQNFRLVRFLR